MTRSEWRVPTKRGIRGTSGASACASIHELIRRGEFVLLDFGARSAATARTLATMVVGAATAERAKFTHRARGDRIARVSGGRQEWLPTLARYIEPAPRGGVCTASARTGLEVTSAATSRTADRPQGRSGGNNRAEFTARGGRRPYGERSHLAAAQRSHGFSRSY